MVAKAFGNVSAVRKPVGLLALGAAGVAPAIATGVAGVV
jgi:hypothetical protein